MVHKIILSIFLCIICGCSTAINYSKWDGSNQLESTVLKYQLQDSSLTMAVAGVETSTPLSSKNNCPGKITDDTWWKCFNKVVPYAAKAPSAAKQPYYVATPADYQHLYFSTTTISGSVVNGQDALYNQITITYTNNTSTIISGAAAGAVAGFGIAGPPGAIAGFVIGGATAVIPASDRGYRGYSTAGIEELTMEDYICKGEEVDLSPRQTAGLKPALYFPLTISAAKARPIASQATLELPEDKGLAECWHTLPNSSRLGEVTPVQAGAENEDKDKKRKPTDGDGWLYRLVAIDGDPSKPPEGAVRADEYFSCTGVRQDFPYSACRKVTLQVTWWKELADAIKQKNENNTNPTINVVTFDTIVADPDYVYLAKVKKGGVINFKADCGANVSMTADHSYHATIDAIVNATLQIYRAEQTWSNNQKK